jgi:flagellar biosynthesis regulator FlbT
MERPQEKEKNIMDIKEEEVINPYLNSVITPAKTITFEDSVIHVEEEKAPKETRDIEQRLRKLENVVFRYGKAIE